MKYLLLSCLAFVLFSCGASREKGNKERFLVTPDQIVGHKYGYSTPMGDMTYYHYVEFMTDSTASILLGGDVMEICKYYTEADSIYVTVEGTVPPYTEILGYTSEGLVDRHGYIWARQQ